jgi:hypothetical protein
MTIKEYLDNYSDYAVDRTYQRPEGIWSTEDMQCLIDTILNNDPMPMFFFNLKDGIRYVVDGQQRLFAIEKFANNRLKLHKKFSFELGGKKYNDIKKYYQNANEAFLSYKLHCYTFDNHDDEKIRNIFSRLQRGKPLQIGEKMNAMPGNIVRVMRDIAEHPFIKKSIRIKDDRYGTFPDVMRILYYEYNNGPAQSGSDDLYKFMTEEKNLASDDALVKNVMANLDFLSGCFPRETGYEYFSKHAWVLTIYSLISNLMDTYYVINGKEEKIRNFVLEFWSTIYSDTKRDKDKLYQKFYDNVRGGWSKSIIQTRLDIIKKFILDELKLVQRDTRRQISDTDKITLFCRCERKCEECGHPFEDSKEPKYHHKTGYAVGGATNLDNIQVLCDTCHIKIHREAP